MIISFAKPIYLLFLNVIPLLILIHFITLRRKRSYALKFANFDAIARVKGVDLLSKNIFILLLTIIICALLVFALSGINVKRDLESSSFSFSLAVDSSESMEATDFFPTRFDAAKETALSFVDATPPGTNMVVISFSGNAFIEQRLTADKDLIKKAIEEMPLSAVGGTDISEAVITSTNLLEGEEAKAAIVISDGRINVAGIDEVILYAIENDIIVHTIAIGTQSGGSTSFGISTVDEDSLKAIAFNTGGEFFRAENKDALQQAFDEIIELKVKRVTTDLTFHMVAIALILIVLEFILVNTRYRVLP